MAVHEYFLNLPFVTSYEYILQQKFTSVAPSVCPPTDSHVRPASDPPIYIDTRPLSVYEYEYSLQLCCVVYDVRYQVCVI